jgi:putative protein kinase ArgK-like GTPase of G3E family
MIVLPLPAGAQDSRRELLERQRAERAKQLEPYQPGKIESAMLYIEREGTLEQRRARNLRAEVLGIASARLRRDLEGRAGRDPELAALLERVVSREIDPATAARKLLQSEGDGSF